MYKFLKLKNIYEYYLKSIFFFIKSSKITQSYLLINLIIRFSIDTFLIIYLKIKYASKVERFKNFCKNFNFSNVWFDNNIPIWTDLFKKQNLLNRNLKILEIGCFEGRATLYLLENLKVKQLICVDPMIEYDELKADFNKVKKKFDQNLSKYDNCKLINATSEDYFKNNQIENKFDLVYLDGDHHADQVYKDLQNIYKNLNNSGIIIIDDLFVDVFKNSGENLINGVFKFINDYGSNIKILYTYHKIIFKKNE